MRRIQSGINMRWSDGNSFYSIKENRGKIDRARARTQLDAITVRLFAMAKLFINNKCNPFFLTDLVASMDYTLAESTHTQTHQARSA